MIKSFIAAAAATVALAGSAVAGPYINAERNDGFVGSDHGGAINEVHVGVEGALTPTISGYAQARPCLPAALSWQRRDRVQRQSRCIRGPGQSTSAYGEVSFVTGDDDNSTALRPGSSTIPDFKNFPSKPKPPGSHTAGGFFYVLHLARLRAIVPRSAFF